MAVDPTKIIQFDLISPQTLFCAHQQTFIYVILNSGLVLFGCIAGCKLERVIPFTGHSNRP